MPTENIDDIMFYRFRRILREIRLKTEQLSFFLIFFNYISTDTRLFYVLLK